MRNLIPGLTVVLAVLAMAARIEAGPVVRIDNAGNVVTYATLADYASDTVATITNQPAYVGNVSGITLDDGSNIIRVDSVGNVVSYASLTDFTNDASPTVLGTVAAYAGPNTQALLRDGSGNFIRVDSSGNIVTYATLGDLASDNLGSFTTQAAYAAGNMRSGFLDPTSGAVIRVDNVGNVVSYPTYTDFTNDSGGSILGTTVGYGFDQGALLLAEAVECDGAFAPDVLSGPIADPSGGSEYYLLEASDWLAAEVAAVALGGHLVTINDAAENAFVLDAFGAPGRTLWIGLSDATEAGNFQWASGASASFDNWLVGEPSAEEAEGFVSMLTLGSGAAGAWDHANGCEDHHAVVEVTPIANLCEGP